MSKKEDLQKVYMDALTALDFEPKTDGDGDIVFKIQKMGTALIVLDADDDPEFLRMMFPNFYDDQKGLSKDDLIALANQINIKNKAVKITVSSQDGEWNVSAVMEAFLAKPDTVPDTAIVKATLSRYLSALQAGVVAYAKAVKEKQDSGQDEQGSI